MDEEKRKILSKIRKCLALAGSSNEHESATAMRQARALMDKYDLDHADVLAAEVSEAAAKASAKLKPADWEANLSSIVAHAFGCRVVFSGGRYAAKGEWLFVGTGTTAEVGKYAFEVLLRQAKKARAEYVDTKLGRYKKSNKVRLGDMFCEAWVHAVSRMVRDFASPPKNEEVVKSFMAKKYGEIEELQTRDRNEGITKNHLKQAEIVAIISGRKAGKEAKLNRAVSGQPAEQQLTLGEF